MRANHRGLVDESLFEPVPLARGQRVKRYLSPNSALVSGGRDRPNGLVQTALPNRVEDPSGRLRPVDVRLRRSGGRLRSARPIVPVEVAPRGDGQIRLPDVDLGTRLDGAASRKARVVNGRAFYASVRRDTDLMVTPLADGVETFAQLRSDRAPEELSFELDLPDGGRAERDPLGGVLIRRGGDVLAGVTPPTAWDADGSSVPVTQRLERGRLVLRVPHRGDNFRYPVVVDPEFVEEQQQWRSGADFRGWRANKTPGTSSTPKFVQFNGDSAIHGRGLYMYNRTLQPYSGGDFGEWYFDVLGHGDAFIYKTTFAAARHTPETTTFYRGIYDRGLGRYNPGSAFVGDGPPAGAGKGNSPTFTNLPILVDETETHCGRSDCGPGTASAPGGPKRSAAIFGIRTDGAVSRTNFTGYLGGAAIFQSDHVVPSVTSEALPTGWVRDATGLAVRATDTGLGMKRMTLSSPQRSDWSQARTNESACTGNRTAPCGSFLRIPFTTEGLPEGLVDLDVTGTDILGTPAIPKRFGLKLDRTGPVLDLSGEAREHDSASGKVLGNDSYDLNIDAEDGSETSPRSGVVALELFVDDVSRFRVDEPCPEDSCELDDTFDFNPYEMNLGAGQHRLRAEATDAAGNKTVSDTWQVNIVSEEEGPDADQTARNAEPTSADTASGPVASTPPGVPVQGTGGCRVWQPELTMEPTRITLIISKGRETTVYLGPDAYRVSRCRSDGSLDVSMRVGPIRIPGGLTAKVPLDLVYGQGAGRFTIAEQDYGRPEDAYWAEKWRRDGASVTSKVIPPTTLP